MVILVLSSCSNKQEEINKEFKRHEKSAESYRQSGQLRAAAMEAQNMIRVSPDRIDGYELLVEIYNQIGSYNTVQEIISPKISQLPSLSTEMARSLIESRKARSAIDILDKYPAVATDVDAYFEQQKLRALANILLGDKEAYQQALTNLKSSREDEVEVALLEARWQLAQGKLLEAENLLTPIAKAHEGNAELLKWLGFIKLAENDLDSAEAYSTKALSLTKSGDLLTAQRSQLLNQLIEILIQQGRSSEAYVYQKMIADANPEGTAAQQRLDEAMEFYQQGKYQQAQEIISQIRSNFPRANQVSLLQGLLSFQSGNNDSANDIFDEYLDPETADISFIQAAALAKLKTHKVDEAIELLRRASEAQPQNALVQTTYGLALIDLNSQDELGAKVLEKSIALNPTQNRLRLVLAKYYIKRGLIEQGLGQLEKAYRTAPLDLVIQQSYLRALYDNKKIDVVKTELDRFNNDFPDNPRGKILTGWFNLKQEKIQAAISSFKEAIASPDNPDLALAYSGLGQAYSLLGQFKLAIEQYQQAIILQPRAIGLYAQWLQLIKKNNETANAIGFLKSLTGQNGSWQASVILAQLYVEADNWAEAEKQLNLALSLGEGSEAVKKVISKIYRQHGAQLNKNKDKASAKSYLSKALTFDPDNFSALSDLIYLEIKDKNLDEAQHLLDEYDRGENVKASLLYLQAQIRFAQNRQEEALEILRQSWQLQPSELVADNIYLAERRIGNEQAANEFLSIWLEKLPHSHRAAMLLAMAALQRGDSSQAIHWYEKTVQIAPDLPAAWNNLAWLYLQSNDKRALGAAEKAIKLQPDSPEILDTYGWILVESGIYKQAVEVLNRAYILAPDNQQIKLHYEAAKSYLK